MKIEGSRPPETQETQLRTQKLGRQEAASAANQGAANVTQGDQVHISGRTKEIEALKEVINQMPEVRIDRIDALRKSIQAGTYKVDSELIAGLILEENK
jgi:negative regulator of flagellin synthesis FlgM